MHMDCMIEMEDALLAFEAGKMVGPKIPYKSAEMNIAPLLTVILCLEFTVQ